MKRNHLLTFECDDFTSRVHDRRVSRDGTSDGIGRVVEVNDDYLRGFTDLLTDTDELVRLHRQCTEPNVGGVDAKVLQLLHNNSNYSTTRGDFACQ